MRRAYKCKRFFYRSSFARIVNKSLRQDGTQPLLAQCRADCSKLLRQDCTDPILGQCRPDNGKPLRQDGNKDCNDKLEALENIHGTLAGPKNPMPFCGSI